MHIPEQGQGTAQFQSPGGFWIADFSRNPVKRLGRHNQVKFGRVFLPLFETGDLEGNARIGLQVAGRHGGQVPARFDAMDRIAPAGEQAGGLAGAAADLQNPAAFRQPAQRDDAFDQFLRVVGAVFIVQAGNRVETLAVLFPVICRFFSHSIFSPAENPHPGSSPQWHPDVPAEPGHSGGWC